MDEYLFMTLAKLKADRLKLEREQRAGAADPGPSQLRLDWDKPAQTPRHSTRWFSQQPLWREQS